MRSAQGAGIVAVDFLHVDTALLKRLCVLMFTEYGTRRMHLGGVTAKPTGAEQTRNLPHTLGGRFENFPSATAWVRHMPASGAWPTEGCEVPAGDITLSDVAVGVPRGVNA